MKKTLQRLGIATVGLSLCLWSCKEQDGLLKPEDVTSTAKVAPKIKENIDFSVVDGRLKFATMEDFKGALGKTITRQEVLMWEKNVGFTSLNEIYKEFVSTDIEGEKGMERVINKKYIAAVDISIDKFGRKNYEKSLSLPGLATLTNQYGMVQIADKVFKFSSKDVRIASVEFIGELSSQIKSNHVEINKVVGISENTNNRNSKVMNDFDLITYVDYPSPGFAARRYKKHKLINSYNLGWWGTFTYLWYAGIRIQNQRNNWSGWGSCGVDSWSWEPGTINIYAVVSPYTGKFISQNLFAYNPPSWDSGSAGDQSELFLGQSGTYESNVISGDYGIVCNLSPFQITMNTFGPQVINQNNFSGTL